MLRGISGFERNECRSSVNAGAFDSVLGLGSSTEQSLTSPHVFLRMAEVRLQS